MKPHNGSSFFFFLLTRDRAKRSFQIVGTNAETQHFPVGIPCYFVLAACALSVWPFNISAISSENEFLRIQPWPTHKTYSSVGSSFLLQAAHVQAEIIQPLATWSRHMEQHSLEESTWSNEYLGLFEKRAASETVRM